MSSSCHRNETILWLLDEIFFCQSSDEREGNLTICGSTLPTERLVSVNNGRQNKLETTRQNISYC
jgi:hypothetical protein